MTSNRIHAFPLTVPGLMARDRAARNRNLGRATNAPLGKDGGWYEVIPLTQEEEEGGNFGPYRQEEAERKESECRHGAIVRPVTSEVE